MIVFIYGDSHANRNFLNAKFPVVDKHCSSITMYRIGRDNTIINFNNDEHDENSILCFNYGEVDCRCHIKRQINLGRNEDDVIHELVKSYFLTIANSIRIYKKIIIIAIVPTTKQSEYENIYGPITHEFPFVGSDEERVNYTNKTNNKLQEFCEKYNYTFFNPYKFYSRDDGCLKFELSDTSVHIKDNSILLEKFEAEILMKS